MTSSTSTAAQGNGTSLFTTLVGALELSPAVPASLLATAGMASVTVLSPAPGGGVPASQTFTINTSVPAITRLNSASVPAGGPAFTLLVNGSSFVASPVVQWDGTPVATTYVGANQHSAQVGASLITASGAHAVRVFNPAPGGGTSGSVASTAQAPSISALAPASINPMTAVSPPIPMAVNGSGFTQGSQVVANGQAAITHAG